MQLKSSAGVPTLQDDVTLNSFSGLVLRFVLVADLALSSTLSGSATAATPAPCDMPLTLRLTPDVPNPSDAGFLSSLLSNHPDFRLVYRGRSEDDSLHVELIGPGPDYLCRRVIRVMRRDGRVLSIHIERGAF